MCFKEIHLLLNTHNNWANPGETAVLKTTTTTTKTKTNENKKQKHDTLQHVIKNTRVEVAFPNRPFIGVQKQNWNLPVELDQCHECCFPTP